MALCLRLTKKFVFIEWIQVFCYPTFLHCAYFYFCQFLVQRLMFFGRSGRNFRGTIVFWAKSHKSLETWFPETGIGGAGRHSTGTAWNRFNPTSDFDARQRAMAAPSLATLTDLPHELLSHIIDPLDAELIYTALHFLALPVFLRRNGI